MGSETHNSRKLISFKILALVAHKHLHLPKAAFAARIRKTNLFFSYRSRNVALPIVQLLPLLFLVLQALAPSIVFVHIFWTVIEGTLVADGVDDGGARVKEHWEGLRRRADHYLADVLLVVNVFQVNLSERWILRIRIINRCLNSSSNVWLRHASTNIFLLGSLRLQILLTVTTSSLPLHDVFLTRGLLLLQQHFIIQLN